jgi:hypothetical protein
VTSDVVEADAVFAREREDQCGHLRHLRGEEVEQKKRSFIR